MYVKPQCYWEKKRKMCIRDRSIAAASILAKTYRDDYMNGLHKEYPFYDWNSNKGYPTKKHLSLIHI